MKRIRLEYFVHGFVVSWLASLVWKFWSWQTWGVIAAYVMVAALAAMIDGEREGY